MIQVERKKAVEPMEFVVTVREGGGETRHEVTMKSATYEKLAGGKASPEQCIRAAFAFLLDREPKESILRKFEVTVIGRYFPEFEHEIGNYLEP
jgi:hypothetical protein